jgi:hypothetical protein
MNENKKYALRMANRRTANRLPGNWPPAWRIDMTPKQAPNYYLFSVHLIMEVT